MAISNFNTSMSTNQFQKDAIEHSTKMTDQFIKQDNSNCDLNESLRMGSELPFPNNVSGLNDQDYPGFPDLGLNPQSLSELNLVKKVPVPPALVKEYEKLRECCSMGLFPEIGRAWLTVDSKIFLWSLHDGSDLSVFNEINETIVCVGLAKPKPGVFLPEIRFILCLATPVQIVLLGVTFLSDDSNSSPMEHMHVLPQPLFSLPTDNTLMKCFLSSDKSRIFFGAHDGCIYEITYEGARNSYWFFGKTCRKINHSISALSFIIPSFLQFPFTDGDSITQLSIDNSRNILYALTRNGSIMMFDLGADGQGMTKITQMSAQNIVFYADNIASTIEKKLFFPVISICAIEITESQHLNLVTVTNTGVRFYFTANTFTARPSVLMLRHVRLPPGFSANSDIERPTCVKFSHYKQGFFMLISSMEKNPDALMAMSNDSFAFHAYLRESSTAVRLEAPVWAIAELPTAISNIENLWGNKNITPLICPLLVTQHAEMPREFVILSTEGCAIYAKPRPVDYLKKLLVQNKGAYCNAIQAFFNLFGESQACAMCVILACSQNPQDKYTAEWAARAFFRYGGVPNIATVGTANEQSAINIQSPRSPQSFSTQPKVWASTPVQYDQTRPASLPDPHFSVICSPVRPLITQTPNTSHQTSMQTNLMPVQQQLPSVIAGSAQDSKLFHSGKHNGLYLHFSRIVWKLWNKKFIERIQPNITYACTIASCDISPFLQQLSALKSFMSTYQPYFGGLVNGSPISTYSPPSANLSRNPNLTQDVSFRQNQYRQTAQSEAEIQERTSLLNLQQLVVCTCEVLGLWKVICDHQLQNVVPYLSQDHQNQLSQMTLRDFVVGGVELCSDLATAVIQFYLDDNASTSAISQRLTEVCPSIYRKEHAIISMAKEIVSNAITTVNKEEKERQLIEALKLCKRISPGFYLEQICELFHKADFYYGIVDLCLCTARQLDPQGLALHYYRNGQPQTDLTGMQLFAGRFNCYEIIISTLNDLVKQSSAQSPIAIRTPEIQPNNQQRKRMSSDEAKRYYEVLFEISLKTDDELFHTVLYNWLIGNDRTDTLLAIQSHFLESFLKRGAECESEELRFLNLLWKFYQKNGNFSAAARVLDKLADRYGPELTLVERIEYLSRATMCVKTSEMRVSSSGEGEFLHNLEEKLEVARIQLQILEAIQQRPDAHIKDAVAISRLNSSFMNVSILLLEFTVPYNLPEIKLAILHCASIDDPGYIENSWLSILDKELMNLGANSPETRMAVLQNRIETLSKPYIMTEKFFPVVFIVYYLELKTCNSGFNRNWLFETLRSLRFSFVQLLDIYHKLYKCKDPCWLTERCPLHLLNVLSCLLLEFVNDPASVATIERRSFVTLCLDVVAGYLVDLQGMSTSDPIVSILISEFRSVQHKLERIL